MTNVSIKFDEKLLATIDKKVEEMSLSRSELCRRAIEKFLSDRQEVIKTIPEDLRRKINFIALILITGKPEKDWNLIRKEVLELCQVLE